MKVLIVIRNSPCQNYLFAVTTKVAAEEIHNHMRNGRHSKAIDTVFRKGVFEKEVRKDEIPATKAKLILSDYNANWDLTK
jgi:DNA-binding protein